jgi:formylglycine-generating enzyme required for sulfatase activity
MNDNPAVFQTFDDSPSHPVEYVAWDPAHTFIARLNEQGTGTFRLPTEAEWEYACRAGTTTNYYWGDETEVANTPGPTPVRLPRLIR